MKAIYPDLKPGSLVLVAGQIPGVVLEKSHTANRWFIFTEGKIWELHRDDLIEVE